MLDTPHLVGDTVVSTASDWKGRIGRVGLVGQGVVATIIGVIAIRIAIGTRTMRPRATVPWPGSPSNRWASSCWSP